jgi:hypothetical protein
MSAAARYCVAASGLQLGPGSARRFTCSPLIMLFVNPHPDLRSDLPLSGGGEAGPMCTLPWLARFQLATKGRAPWRWCSWWSSHERSAAALEGPK